MKTKQYLTPKEVAEEYGLNARTLERWRSNRFGPRFVKFDRKVLYSRIAIESFLELYTKDTVMEYVI